MSKEMSELFQPISNRMMDNLKTGMWFLLFGGGIIIPLLYLTIGVPVYHEVYVQPFCLSHGYKESRVTIFGKGYCVNRVDQTDVVIPLSEVK